MPKVATCPGRVSASAMPRPRHIHRASVPGLLADGWSANDIAEICDVSRSTAFRWCSQYRGRQWTPRQDRWSAAKTRRMAARIRKAKEAGMSNREIAASLGCSKSQVQRLAAGMNSEARG